MKITIVGGGTAGWITALMARQLLPQHPITLVQSSEIGVLGAGEGTTPHFVELFLDVVGISVAELVTHAGATFKNSITFTDWCGPGSSYSHPFHDEVTPVPNLSMLHPHDPLPNEQLSFSCHVSTRNRLLFSYGEVEPGQSRFPGLVPHGKWALHFDAVRLARYLEEVGLSRGVRLIDGVVDGVESRPDGGIAALTLRDGGRVEGDLFFDCTGFRRLLIGEHFGVPFVDVGDTLPVDRAVPFSLPLSGPRPPYTEAIAMPAGWAWKIPVEGRFGCGYVYDSEFATEDEARGHLRERFGHDLELPRVLPFRAGYHREIWVKNCVAVGLSSGFLEPLEATSIWASIQCLRELFRVHLPLGDQIARDDFNAYHRRLNERIVDFLYAHYLGGRQDTPFWRTFSERTRTPPVSARILARGGYRWPLEEDPLNGVYPTPFPVDNWIWVTHGLGLIEAESLERYWSFYGLFEGHEQRIREHVARLRRMGRPCIPHEEMLARLREA